MTIPSTVNRNDYTGNGAVSTYSYTYKIFTNTDLKVTVADDSAMEFPTLVLTTDYTVTGAGDLGGGTIVLVNSGQAWLTGGFLTTDYKLTVRRVAALTQDTDIRNQGTFFPEVHEDQFDRGAIIAQQQQDEIDRTLKLAETLDPATFDASIPSNIGESPGASIITNPTSDGFIVGPTAAEIAAAEAEATAAAASASAAAASAVAAADAVSAVLYRDVQFVTFGDSPVTLTLADSGKLFSVDASGGAVVINLPVISTVTFPAAIAVKKADSSANTVTLARQSTDQIDGGTSFVISAEDAGVILTPDTDTSPDEWTSQELGASVAGTANQIDASESGGQTTISIVSDPVIPGTGAVTVPSGTTAQQPGAPTDGMIRHNSDNNEYEAYANAVWGPLGGGGSGLANALEGDDTDFENTIGNYIVYADAAGSVPVDGTGGAGAVTFTQITSGQLRGKGSGRITKDAADRQGEGVSVDFTLDPADRNKNLQISCELAVSSGFVLGDASDLRVYVYDVDLAAIITPSTTAFLSSTGFAATFDSTTSTNYRLIFHVATTSAVAWTADIDSVFIGAGSIVAGAAMSDPTNTETVTITGTGGDPTKGTIVTDEIRWGRSGKWMEGSVTFEQSAAGTNGTGDYRVTVPGSFAIDTAFLNTVSGSNNNLTVGQGLISSDPAGLANATRPVNITVVDANTLGVFANNAGATDIWGSWSASAFALGSTVVLVTFTFRVPIAEWSSDVVLQNTRTFRIAPILANGTEVSGTDPTQLGEYRVYRRDASALTYNETTATPTDPPTAADGFKMYGGEPWATADPVNEPSRYRVFVGKDKIVTAQYYSTAGKTGLVSTDVSLIGASSYGIRTGYDPTTGVFELAKATTSIATTGAHCGSDPHFAGNVSDVYVDLIVSEKVIPVDVTGGIVTAWKDYTPTFTGMGTVTLNYAKWKRNGDSLHIQIGADPGTPTAVLAKASLPLGLTAVVPSDSTMVGTWIRESTGSAIGLAVLTDSGDTSAVFFGATTHNAAPSTALTPKLGTAILASGDPIAFTAEIQISDWAF